MKRELEELSREIRGVSTLLMVLSDGIETEHGRLSPKSLELLLYSLQQELDRIADDIDEIETEELKKGAA